MRVWGILVAAGDGSRLGIGIPKALVPLGGEPLVLRPFRTLASMLDGLVVVVPPEHLDEFGRSITEGPVVREGGSCTVVVTTGGSSRQGSVREGIARIPQDAEAIVVHDAARPFVIADDVRELLEGLADADAVIPALPITDTVKRVRNGLVTATVDRAELFTVETPQVFRAGVLRAAHAMAVGEHATDDAALVEAAGGSVRVVVRAHHDLKVTTPADYADALERLQPAGAGRSGIGFDAHQLVHGRPLVLGCVEVPFGKGPEGHSDGDVVAHAVCDALLGAANLGDLGDHFPSSDDRWRGARGSELLAGTVGILAKQGFAVSSIDATVIVQEPPIAPHRIAMAAAIAAALGIDASAVSVKATTTDRLGITGHGEGVAATAVATVVPDRFW